MSNKRVKRPTHINKAMKELRSYARSEMAKTEIVQFRVDQADFERLVEAATANQMPMGAMVRKWVLEYLEQKNDLKWRSATTPHIAESSSLQINKRQTTAGLSHLSENKKLARFESLYRDFIMHREREMTILNNMLKLILTHSRTKDTSEK
jgi:hypothetical protein